jgi:hypothetical protein
VDAYQQVVNSPSENTEGAGVAKLAIARIYETQGKLNEAFSLYGEVVRADPNGALGSEASMRAMELKSKSSSASSTTPIASFNLSH